MEEIEVKFLNIDKAAMEENLRAIGAKKAGEYFYRRQVFDYPDLRLDRARAWVRIRDEGERVTMGFKQRIGRDEGLGGNDAGMREIEFVIDDFGKGAEFLYQLGLVNKFYQENRRTRYVKDGAEFDIDEWPLIQPYLEIEAKNWDNIDRAISWLGLRKEDAKLFSTTQVYALSGINDKDYTKLMFKEAVRRM